MASRLATFVVFTLFVPNLVHADGDESFSRLLQLRDPGLGMTSVGVGLSGRREGGPDIPSTEGTMELTGVPAGASILHAFLYWAVYGPSGDDTVTFGTGSALTAITGSLIGTSADSCWSDWGDSGAPNRVYRADVTARVTGNATFRISGFPSATATADTQGASLVVVFDDPAVTTMGTVVIFDGAITGDSSGGVGTVLGSFPDLIVPSLVTEGAFRIGAGDGQSSQTDGALRFADETLPVPAGNHWGRSSGEYWDDRVYDVTSLLIPGAEEAEWRAIMASDCVAFVYAALSFRGTVVDGDADGIDDAVDNCVSVPNSDQANPDGDRFGSACDNCPDGANDSQSDADDDGVGNLCDNCRNVPNPGQENADGDEDGDACDDDPGVDAGPGDAGPSDGGAIADDAGVMDAGSDDGGVSAVDAATPDASTVARDAGRLDALDSGSGAVGSDGGCGCRVGSRSGGEPAALGLLVLAAILTVRRARRRE